MSGHGHERPAFKLDDVALGYRGHVLVGNLTGSFEKGSLTALVGRNGAGKTTLLKALLGTIAPISGRIERMHHRRDVAYLPQISGVDQAFPITVRDFVCFGLWPRIGSLKAVDRRQSARIDAAIEIACLRESRNAWIQDLSGGQFQRARFARLILHDAPVVLLDEPFAAVDQSTSADLLKTIMQWHAAGRTMVAAMHDLELVRTHFPRTLVLAGAASAWGDTSVSLMTSAIRTPHGAAPAPAGSDSTLRAIR